MVHTKCSKWPKNGAFILADLKLADKLEEIKPQLKGLESSKQKKMRKERRKHISQECIMVIKDIYTTPDK